MPKMKDQVAKMLKTLCFLTLSYCSMSSHALQSKTQTSNDIQILENYMQQQRQVAGLDTHQVQLGDIQWTYSEGGSIEQPSVVLLHGMTGNRDHWNRLAQFLTPHYHVIIPDLPKNGDTVVPEDFNIALPNVMAELRVLIEHLGVEDKLHMAGHSLGGSIATLYAAEYPFDTQSLFLLNSAGIYKHTPNAYSQNATQFKKLIVSRPGELDAVLHQFMQNPPNLPYALKIAQEKQLIARAEDNVRMIDQLAMLSRIYTPDSFARLTRTIEAPTLILWGKQDKIINPSAAHELQGLLKRAEKPVLLNNVGHVPMLEAEQQVAQHYLPFLAKTQRLKNPLADKVIPLN